MDYYRQYIGQDDELSAGRMNKHAERALSKPQAAELADAIAKGEKVMKQRTAWRIEGTLREFPKFTPVDIWFEYPIHKVDTSGILADLDPEWEKAPWQKAMEKRKDPEQKKKERITEIDLAYEEVNDGEGVTAEALSEIIGVSKRTIWRRLKEHGGFEFIKEDGRETIIVKKGTYDKNEK